MVSFEIFVKSMPPSLSDLKVTPSFCFAFKIPDNPTATTVESLGPFLWMTAGCAENIISQKVAV